MFVEWFLSEVCLLHVCGNGWDQCMFYVCFMIGFDSLQYDWFPLTNLLLRILRIAYTAICHYSTLNTVLKCAENLAAAKTATLTAARKRQQWPQQATAQATALAKAAESSTGHSAQAVAMAAALAAKRTRQ